MKTRADVEALRDDWERAAFKPAQLLTLMLERSPESRDGLSLNVAQLSMLDAEQYAALEQALDVLGWPARARTISIHDLTRQPPEVWRAARHLESSVFLWNDDNGDQLKERLAVLRASTTLTHLTLELGNARAFTAEAVDAIPDSITHLELRYPAPLDAEQVRRIADHPNLERVALVSCIEDPALVETLLSGEGLTRLRDLNLEGTRLTAAELELLLTHPKTAALTGLSLTQCDMSGALLAAFLGAERFSAMERLSLRFMYHQNWVDALEAPLHALANVRELDLNGLNLEDAMLSAIFEGEGIPHLRSLNLQNNRMTEVGVETLIARLGDTHRCKVLHLQDNRLGDAGLERLAQWEGLACVEELTLGSFRNTHSAGYKALCRSPHLGDEVIMRVHPSTSARVNFAMAIHPGVRPTCIDAFAQELPARVWKETAAHLGIKHSKSATRSTLARLIRAFNAEHPDQALSPWEPPVAL